LDLAGLIRKLKVAVDKRGRGRKERAFYQHFAAALSVERNGTFEGGSKRRGRAW